MAGACSSDPAESTMERAAYGRLFACVPSMIDSLEVEVL